MPRETFALIAFSLVEVWMPVEPKILSLKAQARHIYLWALTMHVLLKIIGGSYLCVLHIVKITLLAINRNSSVNQGLSRIVYKIKD